MTSLAAASALLVGCVQALAADQPAAPPVARYAVVVSQATARDPAWAQVVEALKAKHRAEVVTWGESLADARAPLAQLAPRHVGLVATPEEARREFIIDAHRLMRSLDDDPYYDAIWGVITGYEPGDALRVVQRAEPLLIRKGAGGTTLDLELFEEGVWYSEAERGARWVKAKEGTPTREACGHDTTAALVETFNAGKPDFFLTTGHASERDWQIGLAYRNGQFRCRNGSLLGVDLERREFPVASENPKVYLAAGNGLIGRIADRESMALAYMHSAGVHQMVGYVVSTWYGYGGWGVGEYFLGQPGRFSFAEAFHANSQALVHQLETRFPKHARANIDRFNIETDPSLLSRLCQSLGEPAWNGDAKDMLGLLWDRDTLAFYGDPAWDARLPERGAGWSQSLAESGGTFTFRIEASQDTPLQRPPFALLPFAVKDAKITAGAELNPVIADTFILLPGLAKLEKGKAYQVTFTASPR